MLRLLADENVKRAIVQGVMRAVPDADFAIAQDLGLTGLKDPELLAWAAEDLRILVSHDRATMRDFALQRVAKGQAMPGVFIIQSRLPVREAIDALRLVLACSSPEEWRDKVAFLPL